MKKIVFILLLPLLIIAAFILYYYTSAVVESDKKYYFPQIETYMKVYKPPFNKYGYVIFSKDSVFFFFFYIDFVRIYKSETSTVSFIINPLENNKIFIVDRWNNAQINQVNFVMEKINKEDTTFFKEYIVPETAGTRAYKVKPPYIYIFIEGYLQSIFLANDSTIYLSKVIPIK
jgi:hypothetical protein